MVIFLPFLCRKKVNCFSILAFDAIFVLTGNGGSLLSLLAFIASPIEIADWRCLATMRKVGISMVFMSVFS